MTFKPMLSGKAPDDLNKLTFPLLASPKLDGIRCVKLDGKALTRSLKPIPNLYVRDWIEKNLPDGFDGELLLKDWTAPFRKVSSAIMKRSGEPEFTYAVFDWFDHLSIHNEGFNYRLDRLYEWVSDNNPDPALLHFVDHDEIQNAAQLQEMMAAYIEAGFEGVMVRSLSGPYKQGRSTTKEGYLLKMKLWDDEEAQVIGFVEQLHNANEAKKNALGRTERSTCKENMVPAGTLGALKCQFTDGTEFEVGTGLDDETRKLIWDQMRHDYDVDQFPLVKVKHQPPPGGRPAGEKPRFPVFLGFRKD